MRQKHCWNNFAFNQSYLAKGKIVQAILLPHESTENWMILHWRIRTGSDWWFSKILRISTGFASILSDQDWTWTEKFRSPLISAAQVYFARIWQMNLRRDASIRQMTVSRWAFQ